MDFIHLQLIGGNLINEILLDYLFGLNLRVQDCQLGFDKDGRIPVRGNEVVPRMINDALWAKRELAVAAVVADAFFRVPLAIRQRGHLNRNLGKVLELLHIVSAKARIFLQS